MKIKEGDIVSCATFLSLKDAIIAQLATDVYLIWIIIVLGLIIVLASGTGNTSYFY